MDGIFKRFVVLLVMLFLIGVLSSCSFFKAGTFKTPAKSKVSHEDDFRTGLEYFKANKYDESGRCMESYLENEPKGENADAAHLMLGKIALYEKDFDGAEKRFVTLNREFPESRYIAEAAHLIEVTLAERKKSSEADQIFLLKDKSERAESVEERLDAEKELVTALSEHGSYTEAFVRASRLYASAEGRSRGEAAAKLIDVVDRMSSPELLKARNDAKEIPFASGLCIYRLGALALHHRDFDKAGGYFEELIQADPKHPMSDKARQAVERLENRMKLQPMRVGVLLPLTGRYRVLGERVQQAIELAGKEARNKSDDKIELVIEDTGGTAGGANKAIEKLVLLDNVIAVIGPLLAEAAEVAAYRAEEMGIPVVSLSPSEGIPEIGPYVFRSGMTPDMQARVIVDYAYDILGKRSFAILYPKEPYGENLAHAFWKHVHLRGGWITGLERYDSDETMFKRHIRRLVGRYKLVFGEKRGRCADPLGLSCGGVHTYYDEKRGWPTVDFDALFIPDSYKRAGMAAPALPFEEVEIDTHWKKDYRRFERKRRRHGKEVKPVQLLGANRWNNKKLGDFGGKHVEGAFFCDGFHPDDESDLNVRVFAKSFTKDYNRTPDAIDAYAYDAVGLVAHVLLTNAPKSREDLKHALAGLSVYEGATGEMNFDKNGEMVNELVILTVKKGKIVPAPKTIPLDTDGKLIFTEEELKEKETEEDQPSDR